MIVYRATQEQYDALNGYQNGVSRLEFIATPIGYITNVQNTDNHDFAAIREQLMVLEQVDYTPADHVSEDEQ